jgi:GMP synthase (glutamine-hydrolysing)
LTLNKSAVALRHVAFEDLDSLEGILGEAGYRIRYLEAGQDPVTDLLVKADLLIVLGGPISVNDDNDYPFLRNTCDALRQRLEQSRPTLGICLGAQLIARALGCRVYSSTKEIGWSPLTLTAAGENSCLRHLRDVPILHWHGETFELPDGATHLATTPVCSNQAFSIDDTILGLQFHIEVTAAGLERWYIGHTLELAQAGIDIPGLRQDSQTHAPVLKSAAEECLGEWLATI